MTLFSYCLRTDDGAAPNPHGGLCTLVICKPAIRRTAKPGDWIVGLGSARSPIGNISRHVVYAMRVSARMSMRAYDEFCRERLPQKIPRWNSKVFWRRVGDCVYDYSSGHALIREGVHDDRNRDTDLGGRNALISDHFFYFGDAPRALPDELLGIVHATQGHKSHANDRFEQPFITWIESLGLRPNRLYGKPQHMALVMRHPAARRLCATRDRDDDRQDVIC
jgi:hypothetical protein